jgi:hypothetical protein
MPSYGEQELVLCGSEAGLGGLILAPLQEVAKPRAKLKEPRVLFVRRFSSHTRNIVIRPTGNQLAEDVWRALQGGGALKRRANG